MNIEIQFLLFAIYVLVLLSGESIDVEIINSDTANELLDDFIYF